MTGKKKRDAARVKKVAPAGIWTHCVVHLQALASKKLQPEVHKALNIVIKIVNFIKSQAVDTHCYMKRWALTTLILYFTMKSGSGYDVGKSYNTSMNWMMKSEFSSLGKQTLQVTCEMWTF